MSMKLFAYKLDGRHTDIIIGNYSDKILILITQTGKVGAFLSVVKEHYIESTESRKDNLILNINTIFGKEDENNEAVATILSQKILGDKPAIFSLNLIDHSKRTINALLEILIKNKTW